jgi:hypothetical protein
MRIVEGNRRISAPNHDQTTGRSAAGLSRRRAAIDIKRNGSQSSSKGSADYFTGAVRVDPLFSPPNTARASDSNFTLEPGARTASHSDPLRTSALPGTPAARILEGINAAKARGVYKGRKPSIDAVEVLRLHREEELGPAAIARRLSIGRASVYRLLGKQATAVRAKGVPMPIRPEMRRFYPSNWPQISRHVRFERAAGICQGCGRPHGVTVRCLPDGRWLDGASHTWRNSRGRPAHWPDLVEMAQIRQTRMVLAAAHLDHNPGNNRQRNLKSLCQRCHMIHDRPHHLAQRRITYLLRRALGDLFLGPYSAWLCPFGTKSNRMRIACQFPADTDPERTAFELSFPRADEAHRFERQFRRDPRAPKRFRIIRNALIEDSNAALP